MRAINVPAFGGPEVLTLVDAKHPEPGFGEVLVRVHATGVNPVDAGVRSGAFPLLGEPSFILGWDVAGVVEEADPGSPWRPGDEVFGMPAFPRAANAYAEYVAAPSRHFARKPTSLTFAETAALPLAGLTAWQALVDMADVQPGQHVLVHGAGGGVGHLAVQIADALGARVTGTASAGKRALVESCGADAFVDYRAGAFEDSVSEVDVALDLVGNGYAERSLRVLRTGGVVVTAVDRFDRALPLRAAAVGVRVVGVAVEPDQIGLRALAALVDDGKLRPHISTLLPLEEASRAHEILGGGGVAGKIVLQL